MWRENVAGLGTGVAVDLTNEYSTQFEASTGLIGLNKFYKRSIKYRRISNLIDAEFSSKLENVQS